MRVALILPLVSFLSFPLAAQKFEPDCPLPIGSIAAHHPIDDGCGLRGADGARPTDALQNEAKNNFCAPLDSPSWVTRKSFLGLQKAADQDHDVTPAKPPEDRSTLKNIYTTSEGDSIGEGSVVQFVGFIIDAHYSNVGKGESVNCKKAGRENNDIHILLDESPKVKNFCHTVTAEISPHFRPVDWDTGVLNELNRPVRLTGQLFFDGSHVACKPGRKANPPRASVWEIHPIYQVDVCKNATIAACPVDDSSAWISIHEFPTKDEREHEAAENDG
jgi:hypothetical protein